MDFPPLLAPGRHYLDLMDIKRLCRDGFPDNGRRNTLYQSLEQLIQELLVADFTCEVFIDGSFLTEKPEPEDIDIHVVVDVELFDKFSTAQRKLFDSLNDTSYIDYLSTQAIVTYPRDDARRDAMSAEEAPAVLYGLEHSEAWLKGVAVLRLRETDVGLRIRR